MNLTAALEQLPHGREFRFIDRLTALDPGKSGAAEYHVRGDETFLKGHFPGRPLFPGVLLVEAGAQLAGVVAQCDPAVGAMAGLKLTAIRNAKILGSAPPGQTLQITARVLGRMANLVQAEVRISAAEQVLLEASVVLSGEV